jgi:hypothetical protein
MDKHRNKIVKGIIEAWKKEKKITFYAHFLSYVLINFLLIFINLYFYPYRIWFIYPLTFWGLGLFAHYFFGFRNMDMKFKELENKIIGKYKKF